MLKVEESMILKLRLLMKVDLLKKVVLRVMLAQKLMLVNESPENKRSNLGDMVDELKLKIEM
jgi:hypothetical protein